MASLLFVPVSGTGKVNVKRQAIEKHVMNNYVAKQNRPNRRKAASSHSYSTKDTQSIGDNATELQSPAKRNEKHEGIERPVFVGSSRLNPFAKYPIDLDMEILSLLDYGMCLMLPSLL